MEEEDDMVAEEISGMAVMVLGGLLSCAEDEDRVVFDAVMVEVCDNW